MQKVVASPQALFFNGPLAVEHYSLPSTHEYTEKTHGYLYSCAPVRQACGNAQGADCGLWCDWLPRILLVLVEGKFANLRPSTFKGLRRFFLLRYTGAYSA